MEMEKLEKTYFVEETKEREKMRKRKKDTGSVKIGCECTGERERKIQPFCGYCNRNGHVERYCCNKNGTPESRQKINEISEKNSEYLNNLVNK